MPPSEYEFRRVMGRFATGVTIVTTRLGDELHGMTVNSVTSVSLEPPLVLVCVDRNADTHDILARSGVFAVNVLHREQLSLSEHFARKETEGAHRLDGFEYRSGATGSPILEGCLAYLDCRVTAQYPGGDHTIFLGEVVEAGHLREGEPLIFYQGRYSGLS